MNLERICHRSPLAIPISKEADRPERRGKSICLPQSIGRGTEEKRCFVMLLNSFRHRCYLRRPTTVSSCSVRALRVFCVHTHRLRSPLVDILHQSNDEPIGSDQIGYQISPSSRSRARAFSLIRLTRSRMVFDLAVNVWIFDRLNFD